jgi:hypothetical protein
VDLNKILKQLEQYKELTNKLDSLNDKLDKINCDLIKQIEIEELINKLIEELHEQTSRN